MKSDTPVDLRLLTQAQREQLELLARLQCKTVAEVAAALIAAEVQRAMSVGPLQTTVVPFKRQGK